MNATAQGQPEPPWRLFGAALKAYQDGDRDRPLGAVREDGYVQVMPLDDLFALPAHLPALDITALDACRGRVLDVGAGGGRHSLALQARGHRVTAIDIAPDAVSAMRQAGVHDARVGDIRDWDLRGFDTLLFLMNGIGVLESLNGLQTFLERAGPALRAGAQVVLESWDFRRNEQAVHRAYYAALSSGRSYAGETRFRIRFGSRASLPFKWLFIDPDTLAAQGKRCGLKCAVLATREDGAYIARLGAAHRAG